jgi:Amt family ammonium transporter
MLVVDARRSSFVYPVVVHWVWGNGFLSHYAYHNELTGQYHPLFSKSTASNGLIDFAGSSVVHMVGGFAGLMGAISLGPRLGRFDPVTGAMNELAEHNVTLMVLGVMMLWFSW